MSIYSVSHLARPALRHRLKAMSVDDRRRTAVFIAYIAEYDAQRYYVPDAYPSMLAYCEGELGMSEDSALKRIRAGRAARRFPILFEAIADGRLHLTAVVRLAPHLTDDNVTEWVAAAAHQSKSAIERMLGERFAPPELVLDPPLASGDFQMASATRCDQVIPEPAAAVTRATAAAKVIDHSVKQLVPEPVDRPRNRSPIKVMAESTMRDKLRHAQDLLSHKLPSGDPSKVLELGLDLLIAKLEKLKFAATNRPRPEMQHPSGRPRYIPAAVKRAVRMRDGGRCTFVSETGRRCASRRFLEYDHVEPVARGGEASVTGLRLRCRTHNQYEAERAFGADFIRRKREAAAAARAAAKVEAPDRPARTC